jgi:hypothetical protein
MLNSGKKFRSSRDKKNKYSNSFVVRKKCSERNKNHSPPFKLNGRSLMRVGLVQTEHSHRHHHHPHHFIETLFVPTMI